MSSSLHDYYTRNRDRHMRDARLLREYIRLNWVKNPKEAQVAVNDFVRQARHANHTAIEMRRYEREG